MSDQYLVLDENFMPASTGFTNDAADWDDLTRVTMSREEPLESALAFHVGLMTGRPLHFLMCARHHAERPDVVAVDDTGRLHVLEVKRDGQANVDAARQLLRYVGGTAGLLESLTRERVGTRSSALQNENVVLDYLLGALVDARMDNKDADGRRARVRRAGLNPEAESERLLPAAGILKGRLTEECAAGLAILLKNPSPAIVGWLVAPHITGPARKLLEKAPAPCSELHVLELEIARLPPRRWVVRRGAETVLSARP